MNLENFLHISINEATLYAQSSQIVSYYEAIEKPLKTKIYSLSSRQLPSRTNATSEIVRWCHIVVGSPLFNDIKSKRLSILCLFFDLM